MWPRLQLVEINDLDGAPVALRDTIVGSLSRTLRWGRMMGGLVAPMREFLAQAGTREVLDLGAGMGGPAEVLVEELARQGVDATFVLTDLYPRVDEWTAARARHPGAIELVPEPVDATRIPAAIAAGRARTVVNVFHHFPPALAQAILADAVASSRGIFVSEAFVRGPLGFLPFAPAGLPALAAEPLCSRRDRLAKALLVWATPIALAAAVWDGLVSTFRVYEEAELRAMVAPLGDRFRWTYGRYRFPFGGHGQYFYGVPRGE